MRGNRVKLVLFCTIAVMSTARCGDDGNPSESAVAQSAVPSQIEVLQTTAAWIPINNSFDGGSKSINNDDDPPYVRNPRPGILFQLGGYKGSTSGVIDTEQYNSILIDNVEFKASDGFYWVDITSEMSFTGWPPPSYSTPVGDQAGVGLFPNSKPVPNCYDPPCGTACTRKIHPLLEPKGLITYWTGNHLYSVTTFNHLSDHPHLVTFRFDLKDPVKIVVHSLRSDDSFAPVQEFASGVHSVKVTFVARLKHGLNDDPPWP